MFKRKKYTMKFKKKYKMGEYPGSWYEVADAYLLAVLLGLKEKYQFDIISTKFKGFSDYSRIKIRCNQEDKQNIFMEYYLILGSEIEKFFL